MLSGPIEQFFFSLYNQGKGMISKPIACNTKRILKSTSANRADQDQK